MRVTNVRTSRSLSKENVDPQVEQSAADSSPAAPAKRKRAVASVASSSTDASAEGDKKKRRTSASKPRTLSKEELADLIARGAFWQRCEADEGEGDGYEQGRRGSPADGVEPVYDDCNEVRRKVTAFFKTGRMTQAAWCRLLGVSSSSLLQVFMKRKVSAAANTATAAHSARLGSADACVCSAARDAARRVPPVAAAAASTRPPPAFSRACAYWSVGPRRSGG